VDDHESDESEIMEIVLATQRGGELDDEDEDEDEDEGEGEPEQVLRDAIAYNSKLTLRSWA
jgi:hypothetical protein